LTLAEKSGEKRHGKSKKILKESKDSSIQSLWIGIEKLEKQISSYQAKKNNSFPRFFPSIKFLQFN
jgi:hypothetical protein